jgi:hypothetical protein
MIPCTELSACERRFRSRIAQLATNADFFLRGTLNPPNAARPTVTAPKVFSMMY